MQIWALIVDSFRESRDRKIFWVMLAITLLVTAAMACIGFEPDKITLLFGLYEFDTEQFSSAGALRTDLIATVIVQLIWDTILGWVGIILILVATAGFFPAMLERGAVDVLLSKPLSRSKLFLGKYLGSMVFVFVHASLFVVLTFLVMWLRWGMFLPGYLATIPLIVLLFSYLYCISVWVAVAYRSSIAAVILSLAAWIFFAGVQTLPDMFETFPSWKENKTAYTTARVARWIVPKTQDITYLASKWCGAAVTTDLLPNTNANAEDMLDRAEQLEKDRMNINPVYTIGSSLLFEAVIVLAAMWKFSRKDY